MTFLEKSDYFAKEIAEFDWVSVKGLGWVVLERKIKLYFYRTSPASPA